MIYHCLSSLLAVFNPLPFQCKNRTSARGFYPLQLRSGLAGHPGRRSRAPLRWLPVCRLFVNASSATIICWLAIFRFCVKGMSVRTFLIEFCTSNWMHRWVAHCLESKLYLFTTFLIMFVSKEPVIFKRPENPDFRHDFGTVHVSRMRRLLVRFCAKSRPHWAMITLDRPCFQLKIIFHFQFDCEVNHHMVTRLMAQGAFLNASNSGNKLFVFLFVY